VTHPLPFFSANHTGTYIIGSDKSLRMLFGTGKENKIKCDVFKSFLKQSEKVR